MFESDWGPTLRKITCKALGRGFTPPLEFLESRLFSHLRFRNINIKILLIAMSSFFYSKLLRTIWSIDEERIHLWKDDVCDLCLNKGLHSHTLARRQFVCFRAVALTLSGFLFFFLLVCRKLLSKQFKKPHKNVRKYQKNVLVSQSGLHESPTGKLDCLIPCQTEDDGNSNVPVGTEITRVKLLCGLFLSWNDECKLEKNKKHERLRLLLHV